jgi:hypothetical protein
MVYGLWLKQVMVYGLGLEQVRVYGFVLGLGLSCQGLGGVERFKFGLS